MTNHLEDLKMNVKVKLSALWASVMLVYLYADVFGFYRPGLIEGIIAGEVAGIQIDQVFLLGFMIIFTIPALMVFISLTLKAKANRWTNIIVSILNIVIVLAFVIGESYYYYIFASSVEVVLFSLIVWYAWKWPKQEG